MLLMNMHDVLELFQEYKNFTSYHLIDYDQRVLLNDIFKKIELKANHIYGSLPSLFSYNYKSFWFLILRNNNIRPFQTAKFEKIIPYLQNPDNKVIWILPMLSSYLHTFHEALYNSSRIKTSQPNIFRKDFLDNHKLCTSSHKFSSSSFNNKISYTDGKIIKPNCDRHLQSTARWGFSYELKRDSKKKGLDAELKNMTNLLYCVSNYFVNLYIYENKDPNNMYFVVKMKLNARHRETSIDHKNDFYYSDTINKIPFVRVDAWNFSKELYKYGFVSISENNFLKVFTIDQFNHVNEQITLLKKELPDMYKFDFDIFTISNIVGETKDYNEKIENLFHDEKFNVMEFLKKLETYDLFDFSKITPNDFLKMIFYLIKSKHYTYPEKSDYIKIYNKVIERIYE